MDKSGFIALINPAIALAISAALFLLWNFRRKNRYIAVLAAGFLMLALAFAIQYVTGLLGLQALKLLSNALIPLGGCLIIQGTLSRYKSQAPLMQIGALCAVSLAAFMWYLYGEPNLAARVYIMNCLAGGLIIMLAGKLWRYRNGRMIDRVLAYFVFVWATQFFLRTLAVVPFEGVFTDGPEFYSSLYWITLTLSLATFLLLFAVLLIAVIALDIAEELSANSYIDPLSGLLNRRGLDRAVEGAIAETRALGMPLSLMLCDLDSFKNINDRFGHLAGDRAIIAFCNCLQMQLTERHICARIGGEEFAAVLPAAPLAAARLFAESVRTAYSNTTVEGIDGDSRLSASFGVAELNGTEDFEALLRRADNALYRAKNDGRDRVKVAAPVPAAALSNPADHDLSRSSAAGAFGTVDRR